MKTLLLTPWYFPHKVLTTEAAIGLVFRAKVDVVVAYDEEISSPSVTWKIPAVLRLKVMLARMKSDVKFSRINVYTRDKFACQYCAKKPPMKSLNYDHVIPRGKGGKTTWDNIVTSCVECNLKKDCRTPAEAGMRLLKRPEKPRSLPLSGVFVLPREVPELWKPYLSAAGAGVLHSAG